MKVLILHNSYKISGGEDVSTQEEIALLSAHGVQVDTYFLSNKSIDPTKKISLAINAIWSSYQYRVVLNKIRNGKYDIVHVQNFFPLFSPSIFYAIKKSGVKIIMSVRNYRLVCPNAMLFVGGAPCHKCVSHKIPFPGFFNKCYRNSYSASATIVMMLALHNFLKTWSHKIDAFICVSQFVKDQLIMGGFDKRQLFVKYNFVSTSLAPVYEEGDYYYYSGRLSEEKGIDLLLDAFREGNRNLIIAGEGPLQSMVESAAEKFPHIRFAGKKSLSENYALMSRAKALILPSRWHEPFGRTIVEAFAHGTPVIASRVGGIPELVTPSQNGFIFDLSVPSDLLNKLIEFENIRDWEAMRRRCYQTYHQDFLPEVNFEQLMAIYNQVLDTGQNT